MLPLQDASLTCVVMCMGWVLKLTLFFFDFFFQINILIGSFLFFKISFSHFFSKHYFVFLLSLLFESSSSLSSIYIYIKGTNVPTRIIFGELFQSLDDLQPKLRSPT